MPITSGKHFLNNFLVDSEQCLQLSFPPFCLRMSSIPFLVLCQYIPYGVYFIMLAKEMRTAQLSGGISQILILAFSLFLQLQDTGESDGCISLNET